MAFVNYPAEYDKMLEKLKNDPGNWIKITLQDVVAEQKVSNHMARNLLTIIRYDNNVRYRLMDGVSRFRPKEYCWAENEKEKFNDAFNISQFYLTSVEEEAMRNKLKKMFDDDVDNSKFSENLRLYYILGTICEKLKMKGFNKEWFVIKTAEFRQLLQATELEVVSYIGMLQKYKILVKSPISNAYKLTFTEEDTENVENEVQQIAIENPTQIEVSQNIKAVGYDEGDFQYIPEAAEMKKFINDTIIYNEKISQLLVEQIKVYEKLRVKDKTLDAQQKTFFAMNDAYNALKAENDILKDEVKSLKEAAHIEGKYQKIQIETIEEAMLNMKSSIMSLVEEYVSQPTFKKNNTAVNNKFKTDIMEAVFKAGTIISSELNKKLGKQNKDVNTPTGS